METNQTIEKLFQRYLNNECNADEIQILLKHFDSKANEDVLKSLIRRQSYQNEAAGISNKDLLEDVFKKIKNEIAPQKKEKPEHRSLLHLRNWVKWSAAAVVILFLSVTIYFLIPQDQHVSIAKQDLKVRQIDIAPGKNNAILTLDNGNTIMLDSADNGTLARQGNANIHKSGGQIAYQNTGGMNTKPVYNTITTSNGNQYQLILTDGTKVWLNAASSIRFPTSFTGHERKVQITGEAYFEVAKDAAKPFKVDFTNTTGEKAEIEVLGTHFNVNTYLDEPDMKTTLLEGSVKIKSGGKMEMLTPGEQAIITSKGIGMKKNVNIDHVMAWRNGYFLFDNTDIYTLMRQVSRWYNVDVKFEGKITEEGFSGKISRDVPLSQFVKVLKLNDVHVRTEGREIIVGS